MSSGLRRPATRDAHTKYFIVLAEMDLAPVTPASPPPYPPYLDWVARTDGTGTVTSVMAAHDFTVATSDFTTYEFKLPEPSPLPPTTRKVLYPGDILKDLGSVVHTYDQLGAPNSKHFCTYRRVQLVAGGDANGDPPHEPQPFGVHTEGPYGDSTNSYNSFWIRTWSVAPYWFRTAAIARIG